MRGGLLGTKLIMLCEMSQELNQSVSLRGAGWLLRQHGGGENPPLHSLFSCFLLFYLFHTHHFFYSHPPQVRILSFQPLTSPKRSNSSFHFLPFPSLLFPSLLLLLLKGLCEHLLLANRDRTKSFLPYLCTGVAPSKWLFLLQFINSGSPRGPGKFHINFDQTHVSLPGPQPPLSMRENSSAQSQAEKTHRKQCK